MNSDPPLVSDLTVEVSTWVTERAFSPEWSCSSQAWSNTRLCTNDAGSISSRKGRRARSHDGESVASLIGFLKWLRFRLSLNEQHVARAGFGAFVWDGVSEGSGRGKVKMDSTVPSGSTDRCSLNYFPPSYCTTLLTRSPASLVSAGPPKNDDCRKARIQRV